MNNFVIGRDSFAARSQKIENVYWNESELSNWHVGITGTSGSGKTHQIRQFVGELSNDVEIDIFDYHGDIEIGNTSDVLFSEQTKYGYNPFVINLDPHFGGVRKATNRIIDILSSNRKLGEQQAAVARHLITEAYTVKWIDADKPHTWKKRDETEQYCEGLYNKRDWRELGQCYPTLTDLERLIRNKLRLSLLGLNESNKAKESVYAMENFLRESRRVKKLRSSKTDADQSSLDKAREKAIAEYTAAMNAIDDGNEFDDLLKYGSTDTLQSLLTRVENIKALSLFNANPPPFTSHRRRYLLKPMATSEAELKMFVHGNMQKIFEEEMQKGESNGKIRRCIVLDEAKRFCDDEPSNPINTIALEGRKFGIELVLASQSPTHFTSDFINSAGTLLILNLSSGDWDLAARKLNIKREKLEYLIPRKNGLVRLMETGKAPRWKSIDF